MSLGRCWRCLPILAWALAPESVGAGPLCSLTPLLDDTAGASDTWSRGDVNCDGAVDFGDINAFVLALSVPETYTTEYPGCPLSNADLNGDGAVNFRDINPFVTRLVNGAPYIGESSYGECQRPRGNDRIVCADDVVTFWVADGVLHMRHENAEYNCCVDDIAITLTVTGNVVHLEEAEILTIPCDCLCCFEPTATVVGLLPGTYTVELCWGDADSGWTCHVATIVVP